MYYNLIGCFFGLLEGTTMVPMDTFEFMELNESKIDERHVIALLILKPKDDLANSIIGKFNYFHHRSGKFLNTYVPGYSQGPDPEYEDIGTVSGPNNTEWYYSDACFIRVVDELSQRLSNWRYSGEPELMILQNNPNGQRSKLDFTNYYCIEIDYGIRKGYIRSFEHFMEQFIYSCRSAVTSDEAINTMMRKKISPSEIVKETIAICGDGDFVSQKEVKRIIRNELFIRSCRSRNTKNGWVFSSL